MIYHVDRMFPSSRDIVFFHEPTNRSHTHMANSLSFTIYCEPSGLILISITKRWHESPLSLPSSQQRQRQYPALPFPKSKH